MTFDARLVSQDAKIRPNSRRHPPTREARRKVVPSDSSRKVVLVGVATNVAVAICKFIAALASGSSAMLAEAFHSTADTGNEILLWVGIKRSERAPDPLHPFGHGKVLYFWSLIVAVFIFGVGGTLGFYEGLSRILKPEQARYSIWNYLVLAIAFSMDFYSWQVSRRELFAKRQPQESAWDIIRRSKDPTVFTVFLEDAAGMLGCTIAFSGMLLSRLFHNPYFDAGSSMLIGVLVGAMGLFLARESGALLVGESANPGQVQNIRRILQSDRQVERVGEILTMQLSPDQVLVAAAIKFRPGPTVQEIEADIDRLERQIQSEEPAVKRIFLEADALKGAVRDPGRAA